MTTDLKPVRMGIAGLGRSGWKIHANAFAELSDQYKAVAVLDRDEARRAEAKERFGCETYEDYDAMLADGNVECVVVAMPNKLHAEWAIRAMEAGKEVVVEKPMATSLADADRMMEVARETGRVLAVFQNRRYEPAFQQMLEVIRSGVLGRIVHVRLASHGFGRRWDWQTLQKHDGGTLNNTCPHVIDQALALFGEGEPKVLCRLDCTLTCGDADDHVKIILHGDDAPMVEIEATSASPYSQDAFLVMGTQGGLRGTRAELEWTYFNPDEAPPREIDERPTADRSYNRDDLPMHTERWETTPTTAGPTAALYRDLYRTLREGAPLYITPESVRRQMVVIEECHRQNPLERKFD